MPPLLDVDHTLLVDLRTHIIIALGNQGKGSEHVKSRDGFCSILNALHLGCNRIPHLTVYFIFQGIELVLCSENHILQLF